MFELPCMEIIMNPNDPPFADRTSQMSAYYMLFPQLHKV
jgi:hypothetical protein